MQIQHCWAHEKLGNVAMPVSFGTLGYNPNLSLQFSDLVVQHKFKLLELLKGEQGTQWHCSRIGSSTLDIS